MATMLPLPQRFDAVPRPLPGSWRLRRAGEPAADMPAAAPPLQLSLADLVGLVGATPDEAALGATARFAVHRIARGATLAHQAASAHALYVVQVGSFKCVKTAEDGYEHVLAFAWRHDVIGAEALADGHYAFSAVALEDSRVVALPLAALAALRHDCPALDAALQALLARQLAHAGEIAEVMAAVAADVRLARFLVQLSSRMAAGGQSARRLLLRMNRRDIANHLGLAHETISRSFRMLADHGVLRVDNRDVEILDLDALRLAARSTRGLAEEALRGHGELACAA